MPKIEKTIPGNIVLVQYSTTSTSAVPVETITHITSNHDKKMISLLQAELDNLTFKYNAIFNNTASNFAILNKKLRYIDFSPAYAEMMASVSDKPLKKNTYLADYVSESELLTETLGHCARALKGETFAVERKLKFENGSSTGWWVQYSPAYNSKNKISGLVCKLRDVGQFKLTM